MTKANMRFYHDLYMCHSPKAHQETSKGALTFETTVRVCVGLVLGLWPSSYDGHFKLQV